MDLKDWIAVIGLVFSVCSGAFALYVFHTNRQLAVEQQNTNRQVATEQQKLQQALAGQQQSFEEKLKREDVVLANRRFFPIIWDQIMVLNRIDPKEDPPIGPDIRKAVNVLELISLYWQAKIIDKQMVVLSFGKDFDDLYTSIDQVGKVPGQDGRTGHDLLTASGLIPPVLQEIRDERNKRFKFIEGSSS